MNAKDATVLTGKMKQLRKYVSSIQVDPAHPGAESLKSKSIIILTGLTKDVKNIFENDKRNRPRKTQVEGIYKTGYPCKPIKPRK